MAGYYDQLTSCNFLFRKKKIDSDDVDTPVENRLARCLNTLDLTVLGIGSTLGAGIYVLAGSVIKNVAGPSIIISFIVAALASVLAGLCYAEFGARVPKTGSAYIYTYVTIGEFMAFIIGWNLILEYVIGTSSVARAFSTYLDSMLDNKMQNFFREHFPMNISGLSPYPDFFAFGITMLITVVLSIGVKESTRINNLFTGVNLCIVTFIIVYGGFYADLSNWHIEEKDLPNHNTSIYQNFSNVCNTTKTCGQGGFFAFGVSGMFAGAAKCFYAFVGFDCIATTGEEVKNPQRAIPLSIIISLVMCTIAYCGVSSVLSLMLPYFLIDDLAPMPEAFRYIGSDWARYLVAVGAICSLSTSLLGGMFPLPRVLYAIASDGLIYRFLARINKRLKTPFIATILSGFLAACMAALFDLNELVNMMSIGTLLAYSLVSISVLILRYKSENSSMERSLLAPVVEEDTDESVLRRMFVPAKIATYKSSNLVNITLSVCILLIIAMCLVLVVLEDHLTEFYVYLPLGLLGLVFLVCAFIIARQPQNKNSVTFKMPLVPFLPLISVFVNSYLMLVLNIQTWIRFGVWMAIGFAIYFSYGITHSSEIDDDFVYGSGRGQVQENSETKRLINPTDSD